MREWVANLSRVVMTNQTLDGTVFESVTSLIGTERREDARNEQ